jgi:hypothetical protein
VPADGDDLAVRRLLDAVLVHQGCGQPFPVLRQVEPSGLTHYPFGGVEAKEAC